jgi:hypothetical protein
MFITFNLESLREERRFPPRIYQVPRYAGMMVRTLLVTIVALLCLQVSVRADNAAFDLIGPRLEMKVTRAGKPLPISQVPNLQPGDRLWIHPDFPEDQSARYLLVVAFLRGSTNPPPENWFTRAETWRKQVREEGIVVTVPQDAQQALIFLAPETSGDFSTLRSAVRDKPGVFVRASQDLNQASLDRTRLEKYLTDVREISDADPKALHDRSILLARTLGIHLEQQCFERPLDQQAACLTQNTGSLVLDDGHSQSMVAALASGPNSDLIGAVTATPLAGGGFYSAYVGAIVDLARVMGNIRTAAYQYIPALVLPKKEQVNLRLNNPPSFRKPMSVIVVGLPAVEAPQLPPLRSIDAKQVYCLQKSQLVLPVEGAPLVFSADIAHDFVLHVQGKTGNGFDLPAKPDAGSGGFLVDTHTAESAKLDPEVAGTLRGHWGFEGFDGPNFRLRTSRSAHWTIPPADDSALIVGRDDVIHLQGSTAVCVDELAIQDAQGREVKTTWKLSKPDELEVKASLKEQTAGSMKLKLHQFALSNSDEVSVQAYSEAAHLESFAINAGDMQGTLKGSRLDEVDRFELKGARFVPAKLIRANEKDELRLVVNEATAPTLQPNEKLVARVSLKDGRVLELPTTVQAPRPKAAIVRKNIRAKTVQSVIALGNQDELPMGGQISFLLKSEMPERFSRNEKIEVAAADESFSAVLSFAEGNLVLRDSENLVATLDPLKAFGSSAFGPLQFRPIDPEGGKGDWQPLAVLVRLPILEGIRCPTSPDQPCQLTGSDLYLIDSVASDPQFTHTAPVPSGFLDTTLSVPRPSEAGLFLKLRDDPSAVSTATLPITPEP